MQRRVRPEQQIQRAIFQHLRARATPGVFAFHCPNGGYRTPREAAIFKGLGVVPGVPDIIAIHDGRVYALELKARGNRPTDNQKAAIEALRTAGAIADTVVGLDAAIDWLERQGLLRGKAA